MLLSKTKRYVKYISTYGDKTIILDTLHDYRDGMSEHRTETYVKDEHGNLYTGTSRYGDVVCWYLQGVILEEVDVLYDVD